MTIFCVLVVVVMRSTVANLVRRAMVESRGGSDKIVLDRVNKISESDPDLHLRVYRTPVGYRILAMQDVYRPRSDAAIELLNELHSDSTYVRMCKNQNCFRARVSPKPWRIGVGRLGPRPGVWPIKEERMAERRMWVARYEKIARKYASCRFLVRLGSNKVNSKAEYVRAIHDNYCRANEDGLEIA